MARGFYEIDENGVWHEIDPFKKADLIVPIRCKDCHYRNLKERPILCQVMSDDWFCADGRKRDEEERPSETD